MFAVASVKSRSAETVPFVLIYLMIYNLLCGTFAGITHLYSAVLNIKGASNVFDKTELDNLDIPP